MNPELAQVEQERGDAHIEALRSPTYEVWAQAWREAFAELRGVLAETVADEVLRSRLEWALMPGLMAVYKATRPPSRPTAFRGGPDDTWRRGKYWGGNE